MHYYWGPVLLWTGKNVIYAQMASFSPHSKQRTQDVRPNSKGDVDEHRPPIGNLTFGERACGTNGAIHSFNQTATKTRRLVCIIWTIWRSYLAAISLEITITCKQFNRRTE